MQKDGEVAVVIVNNPPVNALSWHVRWGLKEHFEAALADDGVKAIVLRCDGGTFIAGAGIRSEEHTSELQSLMRISYAVFCLKKKKISDKIITLPQLSEA